MLIPKAVWGQVIPDSTTLTPNPGSCIPLCTVIGGNTDSTDSNLFHSFTQFSVPEGGTVVFDHPTNIRNIITRVTGGNESTINGIIRTNLTSETNLFMLNPSGIFFGPNGQLDIGGSFAATTADAIQFGEQGVFSAIDTNSDFTLLTVDPSAFLFTQAIPQTITSQSTAFNFSTFSSGLSVPENKSLLLIGGDIVLERSPTISSGRASEITVPGGQVELGGLRNTGIVNLTIDGDNLSLTYPNNIDLADVFLERTRLNTFTPFSGAGTVIINANHLVMDNSLINSITFGPDDAGEILITTDESVTLDDSTITSSTAASGGGGNITIITERLSLNNSRLGVGTSATGDGGTINLRTTTTLLNDVSVIESSSLGTSGEPAGDSGELAIQTDVLSINDSGINIKTSGDALNVDTLGNLIINANNRVSVENDSEITSETVGQRNAGDITINTPSLVIDNSRIAAAVTPDEDSSTGATGQGGQIMLDTQRLSLNNNAQITSSTSGEGAAGAILFKGDSLAINFEEDSEISAATNGLGDGGQILIAVPENITLSGDGSLSARSTSSGPAGDVFIQTDGQFHVQDGARVEVSGNSSGNSGILEVVAGTTILNNGQLRASVEESEEGNITLDIEDALILRNNSLISAEASNDANGGNVTITTPFIIALFPNSPDANGNDILAIADEGDGGRINIQANTLFNITENEATPNNRTNDLDATSDTGIDGEVIISTLQVDPDEGTLRLPPGLAEPAINQSCQASITANGEFTNSGRGGLAANPYDPLSRAGIQEDIYPAGQITAQQEEPPQVTETPEPLIEAQGWNRNAQGDIVLLATDYQSSCQHTSTGAR
ncbi:MAG: filamentous hemagglutinin N-terminal domain-containing protein [Cyanobacteria bacterium P01_F01_bin.13]